MAVSADFLDDIVLRILDHPTGGLGGTTLVCIDGPAGSGKSTLAAQLGPVLPAQVVHMDDLYEGWTGMQAGIDNLFEWILHPLHEGLPGRYRRYDWGLGTYAERHNVPFADYLIVEGCGSAVREVDEFDPFIIWVEADDDVRLRRGLDRDGEDSRDNWLQFMATETELYAAHDIRDRAHLRLNGFGHEVVSSD